MKLGDYTEAVTPALHLSESKRQRAFLRETGDGVYPQMYVFGSGGDKIL